MGQSAKKVAQGSTPETNKQLRVPFKVSWSRQPDMTIHEQRVILRIMEHCQSQINGVPPSNPRVKVEYYKKTVEITMPIADAFSKKVSAEEARIALERLSRRFFDYSDNNMWWTCGYIEHPEVHPGTGLMSFGVYTRLWEIIKAYTEGFHNVELLKALALPTPTAIRFYLMLSENTKKRIDMPVDGFKRWMGIPDGKYRDSKGKDRIDNLENRIIRPAQKALDETCPWTFTYDKIREQPGNPRSRVTGFAFYPVKQPHLADLALKERQLQQQVSTTFLLTPQVIDYLKTNFGATMQFLSARKVKLKQWEDLEPDPIGWLSARRRLANEAKVPSRDYIFGAICRRISELMGDDGAGSDTRPETPLPDRIAQRKQSDTIATELVNLFNYK